MELEVVADQQCTPTYVPHLAEAILYLLQTDAYGTYHVTNSDSTTWHQFATEIFHALDMPITVKKATSLQFISLAKRPAYSVLDTTNYHDLSGPRMLDWRDAVRVALGIDLSSSASDQ